jgi:hypothetical protein
MPNAERRSLGMMLNTVVEPVFFRSEPDRHACRTTVASDQVVFLFDNGEDLDRRFCNVLKDPI